ncbi:cadherin-6-like [Stigmatopora nigra]
MKTSQMGGGPDPRQRRPPPPAILFQDKFEKTLDETTFKMSVRWVGFLGLIGLALSPSGLRAHGVPGKSSDAVPEKNLPRRVKRGWLWNQFFLQEEYTGSDYLYIGKLQSDEDRGDGLVKYVLSGEGAGTIFVIDQDNGDLHATRRLDREKKASYVLEATVVDKMTGRTLEPRTEFVVKLHDVNDNEPRFQPEFYSAAVPEHSILGTSVIRVTATDADDDLYGNSAKLVYSLREGQPYFSVDANTGVIRTALGPAHLDREQRENFQVVIQAKDMAGHKGGLTGTAVVNISLSDVNDNLPRFTQRVFRLPVSETSKMGAQVGRIKATDRDVGRNAQMDFAVVGGDGADVFSVFADQRTQEGVIVVSKPLDYESKRSYTVEIQVGNVQEDARFTSAHAKDVAAIHVAVEDVDEPPRFQQSFYLLEIEEDAAVGAFVGVVSAVDEDAPHSPVEYSLDGRTNADHLFHVHARNGTLFLSKTLDREVKAWHNISVLATEIYNLRQSAPVSVYVKVLDVNDNAPTFAAPYRSFVCEKAKAGRRIQTVSAVDADEPSDGHHFSFSHAPAASKSSLFTVIDNGDNTGSIVTREANYSRLLRDVHLLPVVIGDGGRPPQTATATLTIRVCACDDRGHPTACYADARYGAPGISSGVFIIAVLPCLLVFLRKCLRRIIRSHGLVTRVRFPSVTMAALLKSRRPQKKELLIIAADDVRDNVVTYDEEGGGEEDTEAFDVRALFRHGADLEQSSGRRRGDVVPHCPAAAASSHVSHGNENIGEFIAQRVQDSERRNPNPAAPHDSLATYAYEGAGSVAESLSSLGSSLLSEEEQDYHYLQDWGPRFQKLAHLYGNEEEVAFP